MCRIHLTRLLDEELAASPEFRYLDAWGRGEAEVAFGSVSDGPADGGAPWLVLAGRSLVGRRSLAAMADTLEDGAAAAVPRRLGSTPLPAERAVYTLRGIERAEAVWIERQRPPRPPDEPTWPAVLLGPAASDWVRDGGAPPERLLAEPEALLAAFPGRVREVGLAHEFSDYYGEVREDVLPFLPSGVRDVLEIGCARGATGGFLKARLGCRVTGVELNPEVAARAAAVLDRVVTGDVVEVDLEGPFDAVLALELFEHLTDQHRFLARIRALLRPGGRLVMSVPNVGHWSIVEDLLAGRWDYLPIGLLCHTHYRFFTRRTLEDWLRAAGFASVELVAQTTEPPDWLDRVAGFEVDAESLRTSGFWVIAERPR